MLAAVQVSLVLAAVQVSLVLAAVQVSLVFAAVQVSLMLAAVQVSLVLAAVRVSLVLAAVQVPLVFAAVQVSLMLAVLGCGVLVVIAVVRAVGAVTFPQDFSIALLSGKYTLLLPVDVLQIQLPNLLQTAYSTTLLAHSPQPTLHRLRCRSFAADTQGSQKAQYAASSQCECVNWSSE